MGYLPDQLVQNFIHQPYHLDLPKMDGTTVKITCSSNVGLVVIHHGKKANHRLQQIQVEYIISVPERDAPFSGVSFPIPKKTSKET